MEAQYAFIAQIQRDRAGNVAVLTQIECGYRFYKDSIDITAELHADARRRLADCNAILGQYA